jgi:hypothetical protein
VGQLLLRALAEPEGQGLAVATTVVGMALSEAVALAQPLLDREELERAELLPAPLSVLQPEGLRLEVPEVLALPLAEGTAVVATAEGEAQALAQPVLDQLPAPREAEAEPVGLTELCTERLPLGEPEALALSEELPLAVGRTVVATGEALGEVLPQLLLLGEPVAVPELQREAQAEALALSETEALPVLLPQALPLGRLELLPLPLELRLPVAPAVVGAEDSEAERLAEGQLEDEAERDAEALTLTEELPLGLRLAEREALSCAQKEAMLVLPSVDTCTPAPCMSQLSRPLSMRLLGYRRVMLW